MQPMTYTGSCRCQRVRFEVALDLRAHTGRCNCSICAKVRNWGAVVKPEAFRLLSGKEDLTDYEFGTKSAHHLFCRHCGVRLFGHGDVPESGGPYVSVSLACLDNASPSQFCDVPVRYLAGRHSGCAAPPAQARGL